jgi:hypothetical protein
MSSQAQTLITLAESTAEGDGVNPWVVGGGILLLLLLLLLAVVAFGGGREHS